MGSYTAHFVDVKVNESKTVTYTSTSLIIENDFATSTGTFTAASVTNLTCIKKPC